MTADCGIERRTERATTKYTNQHEKITKRNMLSESRGIEKLNRLREEFREAIRDGYESRAKSCSTCETPGACCLDAHFVNVRVSRLEAAAITKALDEINEPVRTRVYERIDESIREFHLDGDASRTYACPLYEPRVGCLVHETAKPLPCIQHACYENKEDLPPDDQLEAAELAVDRLNRKVYGRPLPLMSLPIAVRR